MNLFGDYIKQEIRLIKSTRPVLKIFNSDVLNVLVIDNIQQFSLQGFYDRNKEAFKNVSDIDIYCVYLYYTRILRLANVFNKRLEAHRVHDCQRLHSNEKRLLKQLADIMSGKDELITIMDKYKNMINQLLVR